MLLADIHHAAILTKNTDQLHAFYREIFDAKVSTDLAGTFGEGLRFSIVDIGPSSELTVFEIEGNTEAEQPTPMFGRGRIDHICLQAASAEAFATIRDRLIARGASDGFVNDFGPVLGLFFRDPEGMGGEVCIPNPAAKPGVRNPPGTPAADYEHTL